VAQSQTRSRKGLTAAIAENNPSGYWGRCAAYPVASLEK
jgi:hypothetical protein